ncbi:MAG: DJ-1/PfpI family protein [Chloroflexota bacterium]
MDSVKSVVPKLNILIGPYFDEESVVSCLCGLQKRGVPVNVVGLTSAMTTGLHGLAVRPDFSLSEFSRLIDAEDAEHSVILPGGVEGTAVLFSDPRVVKIIKSIFEAGNHIAAMLPAQQMLSRLGLPTVHKIEQFLPQNDLGTEDFIDQIADRLN